METLLTYAQKHWDITMEDLLSYVGDEDECVMVSCSEFQKLIDIADKVWQDTVWEIDYLMIKGIKVSYDPYEDWDAYEI